MGCSYKERSSSTANQVVSGFPWESRTRGQVGMQRLRKTSSSAEKALGEDGQQLWVRSCCWFCRSVGGAWKPFASPELEHRTESVLMQDPVALPTFPSP